MLPNLPEQSKANPSDDDPGPNGSWGCLVLLVAGLTIAFLVSKVLSPSDWVDVTIGPLPDGYREFCVLAEDSSGISALPWYHAKAVTFTDDPFLGGYLSGGRHNANTNGFLVASVQWKDADRYGVLTEHQDGSWRLQWLEPSDVERPSARRFFFGGGTAEMRLPTNARPEVPSRQLLEQLGVSRENLP